MSYGGWAFSGVWAVSPLLFGLMMDHEAGRIDDFVHISSDEMSFKPAISG